MFPEPLSSDLITVPACDGCNGGASKDDEYFVWAVTMSVDALGDQARRAAEQRLQPPLSDRRRRMVDSILTTGKLVNLLSPGGIFLGRTLAFDVDRSRLNHVVERCVRGLYFKQFHTRVPDDHQVVGFIDPPGGSLQAPVTQAVLSVPVRSVAHGAFQYWLAAAADSPSVAFCVMRFFEGIIAVGFVLSAGARVPTADRPGV
jgi:hypothetical protein